MNGTTGLTAGDLALLKDNNGFMDGNGSWVFFLFLLLAWGGNGFGGFGGNRSFDVPATKDFVSNEFNNQNVINKLNGLENGLCDGFYSLNNSVRDSSYATQTAINNLSHNVDNCCCTTNRNIDAVRYENAKNTYDIVNAIHADGEATRELITQNTIQDLRDRLNERDRQLQSAQFQISQVAQTDSIVNQIKPCPVPAYLTCSPYFSYNVGCGCTGTVI